MLSLIVRLPGGAKLAQGGCECLWSSTGALSPDTPYPRVAQSIVQGQTLIVLPEEACRARIVIWGKGWEPASEELSDLRAVEWQINMLRLLMTKKTKKE